uniref:ERAP1-like C-terminal domain-containing protein n=1 Tax=Megaselia scalaris TaxID=36166 RepID=T1GTL7_MEGSC
WVLARYLRYAISGKDIRKQDIFRVFAAVSTNSVGQQLAFDFIRTNWDEIKAYLGSTMNNLYMILSFPTKRMNTKYNLIELEDFIKIKFTEIPRSVQQHIEQIKVNIDWMDRNYAAIVNWLESQKVYN